MGQDPGSDHDGALDDPVGDPGRDTESQRGQGIDEGSTIKDRSDGDKIFDDMHDRLCGITDKEVGRNSITDLFDGEVHWDVVLLKLLLGLDLVLDDNTMTDLVFNNVRGCHYDLRLLFLLG